MQKITENTYQKVAHLLSNRGVDSEKALLTSKGAVYGSRSVAGRFLRFLGIAKPVKLTDFKAFLHQKLGKSDMHPVLETTDKTHLTGRSFRQLNQDVITKHNADVRRNVFESFAKLEDGLNQVDEAMPMYHYAEQMKHPKEQYQEELATIIATIDREFDQMLGQGDAVVGETAEHLRIPDKTLMRLSVSRELMRAKLGPDSPVQAREYHQELLEKGFSVENKGDFNPAKLADETGKLDNQYKAAAAAVIDMEVEAKARAQARVEEEQKARAEEQAKARAQPKENAQAGARPNVRRHRYILSNQIKDALRTLDLDPAKYQQLTMQDITRTYKKVSLRDHPDKVQSRVDENTPYAERARIGKEATEKFQRIGDAYDLLLRQDHIFC